MRFVPTCISEKRLSATFNLDTDTAKALRAAMRAGYGLNLGHWSHAVGAYVDRVAMVLGLDAQSLYGETLRNGGSGDNVFYVNSGDPYVTTLIFDYGSDRWFLGCWGDLIP